MPDCRYGSWYEPVTSPLVASSRGPVPVVTPLDEPRDRSARAKLTAGTFAGCGTSVGVGEGVLVVTTSLGAGVLVASGGGGVPRHAAESSAPAGDATTRDRRAPLIRARRSPVGWQPRNVRGKPLIAPVDDIDDSGGPAQPHIFEVGTSVDLPDIKVGRDRGVVRDHVARRRESADDQQMAARLLEEETRQVPLDRCHERNARVDEELGLTQRSKASHEGVQAEPRGVGRVVGPVAGTL